MRFISFNVNGIRAIEQKGFKEIFEKENPDFLCLQEIKADESAYPKSLMNFNGYRVYLNPAEKKGYSGTAIYTKETPLNVIKGIGFDNEGRVLTLEFEKFYLVNIYFPNSQPELARKDFRMEFNQKLLEFANELKKRKHVIMCGDFNVAHNEIDLARPKENVGEPGFADYEREWFTKLLTNGYIDTFRELYKEGNNYTWWSYRSNAREKNVGWRIDYFVTNKELRNNIKDAKILNKIFGSDHCPVEINLDI